MSSGERRDGNPPKVSNPIEESLLRTVIGGGGVMAGQLGHLITVASLPSIFDERQVNVELVSGWLTLTQPREIAMYGKAFSDLSDLAVRGVKARALITKAIDALS
jgi:hypothetical protein